MFSKKSLLIINMIISSIILTSCTGSREINELGIIMSTGIDYEDGKVVVTNEVMMPSSKSSGGSSTTNQNHVLYLQHKGDTIFDAIRNATLTFDRRLFLSHNRVLIFGEEFAKRGIGDYINFYAYDAEPRETAYLVVAKGAKAYEVMGVNEGLSDAPGKYLEGLIENYKFTSKTRSINLNEYFRYFYQRKTPVLGVVQKEEKTIINKERASEQGNFRLVLNVEGGAAFYRDSLIGYYSGEEMIGFNFIIDEVEDGLIVFEVPDEFNTPDTEYLGTKGKYTVLEIKSNKTKKNIQIVDDNINLTIDVKLNVVIGEDDKGLKLTDLKVKNAIEKACSNKVEEYISMVMNKAQKEFKIDTFGIDAIFHSKYPKLWREVENEWESIFTEINYQVNVKTNIQRTGLIDVPTNIEKGDTGVY